MLTHFARGYIFFDLQSYIFIVAYANFLFEIMRYNSIFLFYVVLHIFNIWHFWLLLYLKIVYFSVKNGYLETAVFV